MSTDDSPREVEDASFASLPSRLKTRIDRAFDEAISSLSNTTFLPSSLPGPSKTNGLHDGRTQPANAGEAMAFNEGGFIIDSPQAGGFILESEEPGGYTSDLPNDVDYDGEGDDTPSRLKYTQIPLSLIPTALQLLDLPPDDEDVLSVFRNAASGWGKTSRSSDDAQEQFVGRRDWRAVCAALLDTGADYEDSAELNNTVADDGEDSDAEDEYVDSDSDSVDDLVGSDDEYRDGGFIAPPSKAKSKATTRPGTRTTSKRTPRATSFGDLAGDDAVNPQQPRTLSARQKQECRRTFGLFFPDVGDEDLGKQRLMIKDLVRVGKLLKEKITAEEIVEMLEAFSSSSDKSMHLADFERMMIQAKLA